MTSRAPLDDEPITLAKACDLFPDAGLTVYTLCREAERGYLIVFKMGRHWCTTPAAMRKMVQKKCQDAARRPASTSTDSAANGSSETERIASGRAALNQTTAALKSGLPRISPQSTRRNAARTR